MYARNRDVSINAAAEAMFRYKAWEVVGKHIGELMSASGDGEDGGAPYFNGIRYVQSFQATTPVRGAPTTDLLTSQQASLYLL